MTDEQFSDYWKSLVDKRYSKKEPLSSDERVFYSANIFRGSVPRSGLIGYFENTECDVIRDAHHALTVLDLPDAARLLQDAQRIALNGNPLPETNECMSLVDEDLPEEEQDEAMEELEEKLQAIQEQLYLQNQAIFDALCRFADERGLAGPKR